MADILTPATITIAKTSAVSGGLFATALIFKDPAFIWMAFVGSFMSVASTFHTIFSKKDRDLTRMQIFASFIKGFALGIGLMPTSFLIITDGILEALFHIELGDTSISLSLMASFLFTWYGVPVLDFLVKKRITKGGE